MSRAEPTTRASTVWLVSAASECNAPTVSVSRCTTTWMGLAPATTCAFVTM